MCLVVLAVGCLGEEAVVDLDHAVEVRGGRKGGEPLDGFHQGVAEILLQRVLEGP